MVNMVFLPIHPFFYKYIYILSFVIKKRHIINILALSLALFHYIISNFALIFYRQVFEACGCVHADGARGPQQQPGGGVISSLGCISGLLFPGTLECYPPPKKKSLEMWLLLS